MELKYLVSLRTPNIDPKKVPRGSSVIDPGTSVKVIEQPLESINDAIKTGVQNLINNEGASFNITTLVNAIQITNDGARFNIMPIFDDANYFIGTVYNKKEMVKRLKDPDMLRAVTMCPSTHFVAEKRTVIPLQSDDKVFGYTDDTFIQIWPRVNYYMKTTSYWGDTFEDVVLTPIPVGPRKRVITPKYLIEQIAKMPNAQKLTEFQLGWGKDVQNAVFLDMKYHVGGTVLNHDELIKKSDLATLISKPGEIVLERRPGYYAQIQPNDVVLDIESFKKVWPTKRPKPRTK